MEYDENQAIEFIRKQTNNICDKYDDDEILNIIDMIFDYFEENGMLDIDFSDDDDNDEKTVADLVAYVTKMISKDKGSAVQTADIEPIVRAELAYEDYLDENI